MHDPTSSNSFGATGNELGFKKLAEALPHLVWSCRPDGWCDYLSAQWLAYTGGSESEYFGFNWSKAVHPDDRKRLLDQWTSSVSTKRIYDVEYRIHRHDGVYRWFRAQAVPLKNETGNIIRWIGTSTDIDAMKRIEHALRESEARKNEFLATLSHELRNPLAPLRSSLQLLRLRSNEDESTAPVHRIMERQVDHLVRLVDDLLEMSRISRGTFELRKELVELASIVRNAVETCDHLIQARGHSLSVNLPEESLWMEGDPVRLAQVLANLLNNAAKYTDAGGKIRLEAQRQESTVRIAVRDNGIGIAPEAITRIFEMFIRGDHSIVRAQSGLGIGLPLARRLAEMHGGTIDARSEGPGKGSEFIVRFVLAANQGPKSIVKERIETTSLRKRILIVDDNRDAADSLGMVLKVLGADVRIARDGPEALETCAQYQPAILLLDIGMPGMDGYEVARQIRARFPKRRISIIALTGWGQDQDRRKTQDAGFDGHLVKPVEIGTLQTLLVSLESSSGLL